MIVTNRLMIQFIMFLGVGSMCYALGLLILWLCVYVFEINYLCGMIIAFFIINPVAFAINKKYVFQVDKIRFVLRMIRFLFVSLVSLILSLLFVWILVEYFGTNYLLANILATAFLFFVNFIAHYLWTFQAESSRSK